MLRHKPVGVRTQNHLTILHTSDLQYSYLLKLWCNVKRLRIPTRTKFLEAIVQRELKLMSSDIFSAVPSILTSRANALPLWIASNRTHQTSVEGTMMEVLSDIEDTTIHDLRIKNLKVAVSSEYHPLS